MKLLFVNTKKNWGGIVNLGAILMQSLGKSGTSCYNAVSSKRMQSFAIAPPVQNLGFSFGFNYNPLAILKLAIFIKRQQIDFVIVNITKEIIFGGIAAKLCGIKCIRLVGNELDFEKHRFLNAFLVDLNIHPSKWTLKETLRQFPYTNGLQNQVLYCGSEDRKISPAQKEAEYQRLQLSPKQLIIGCTGRIVEDKGVLCLLQAFALLKDKLPQAVLVINGKGKFEAELAKHAAALGIANRVRLQGFAPDCLVAASIYDIAVMPSRLEGFPNTMIEYLSLAKALITTPVGGVTEAITDGVNGLVFQVDKHEELADKILLLATNPELKLALETAGYQSYLARFTASAMAANFVRLIKAIQ